ncbi:UDP-N-acetylmuramoyl-tripeptide--D-alanyl-D-alanine ligase [Motiliproteus sp.]|uniref:UDP-N-acetylmuramoyl-tripeptide--D-alanyl-D- alanine ligase n=1 Tax=Motiliproteus sp. TaxID=1898955 RepID=UPI003BA86AF6
MLSNWKLSDLQQPLAAQACQGEARIQGVSTDSRSLKSGDLFVALNGPNFDGNRFVEAAKQAGAVAAVVSELQPIELPQLLVKDTRIALGQLARLNRQAFEGPLVAVTGSSGKTSVKEMLARIFEQRGPVLATRGNLNNDIGAPLTLLSLQPEHQYAVVELGASGRGEIAYTTDLARPDVAILNNAGGAHLEGFGSLQGVVEAKGEIFDGLQPDGVGVVNLDDPNAGYWLERLEGRKLRTFSLSSPMADLFASHLETANDGCCRFVLNTHDGQSQVKLQVMGRHMVANALAAASAANALGFELEPIRRGLESYSGVAGRLAPQPGLNGSRIIDDSYNANPDSVKAAIRVLASLSGTRCLVLGDMAELGPDAVALHQELGRFAAEQGLDAVYTAGQLSRHTVEAFTEAAAKGSVRAKAFEDKQTLLQQLRPLLDKQTSVLIKGSRSAAMEQVVDALIAAAGEEG